MKVSNKLNQKNTETDERRNLFARTQNREIDLKIIKVGSLAVVLAAITLLLMGFPKGSRAVVARDFNLPFSYDFRTNGVLDESRGELLSSSPYFWLISGGKLIIENGEGRTIFGDLASTDKWFKYYSVQNPVSTDGGLHPQNVFQIFVRKNISDSSTQIYFNKSKNNLLNVLNIKSYNGISILSRRVDENHYYYAGIRADGGAVIKKKSGSTFTTLAYKSDIFSGSGPDQIPINEWIGLKMETLSEGNSVRINLFVDRGNKNWQLIAEAVDEGLKFGSVINSGLTGIQSDFADTRFDNLFITSSSNSSQTDPVPVPTPPAVSMFSDSMNYSDGLITNEFAYWNPTNSSAKISSKWEMTSGSLFAQSAAGWSGVPDSGAPNALSTNANNSAIFRLTTKESDFQDVSVKFDLLNQGLSSTSATPAVSWDGVHVFLRYQNEESLYYASINRRDNKVIIKKKVPGGPSNGGTYYDIGSYNPYDVPYNSWQDVEARIKNNSSGSVTIELYAGGKLLTSATDNGIGGAPIRTAGKTGIRADNANIKFKNFTVSSI